MIESINSYRAINSPKCDLICCAQLKISEKNEKKKTMSNKEISLKHYATVPTNLRVSRSNEYRAVNRFAVIRTLRY